MHGDRAPATNRLARETSVYLRQHMHNPVDWHPWGAEALERVTREAEHFLRVSGLAQSDAFEGLLDAMLVAFTRKIGDLLGADRASLFLLDAANGELWSKAARDAGGELVEIRIPRGKGIAGAVAESERVISPSCHA